MKNKYFYLALLGLLSSGAVQAGAKIKIVSDKDIDVIVSANGQDDQKFTVSANAPTTMDMPMAPFQIKKPTYMGLSSTKCESLDPGSYYGMGTTGGKMVVTFTFTKDGCSDDRYK